MRKTGQIMEKTGQEYLDEKKEQTNANEYFTLRELFNILYGRRKTNENNSNENNSNKSTPLFSQAGTITEDSINEEIEKFFLKKADDPEKHKQNKNIKSNYNKCVAASEKLKQYQVKKHGEEQLGQFFFPQLTDRYGDLCADLYRLKSDGLKGDMAKDMLRYHYEGNETLGRHITRLLNPYTKSTKASSLKAMSEDREYISQELLKNDSLWNLETHFMAVYFILKKSKYDKNEFKDRLLSFLNDVKYVGKIYLEKADDSYPDKDIKRVIEMVRIALTMGKDVYALYNLLLLACFQDELTTELADRLLSFTEDNIGPQNQTSHSKAEQPAWSDEGIRPLSAYPFTNTFIERRHLLKNIEEGFKKHKLILISGVTGEGKSELSRAFVWNQAKLRDEGSPGRFKHFIWLSCSEENTPQNLNLLEKQNGRNLKNEPETFREDVLYIIDGLNTLGRGILTDLLEKTGNAGVLITSLKSIPETVIMQDSKKILEIPIREDPQRKKEFAEHIFLAYLRGNLSSLSVSDEEKPLVDSICSFFGYHTFACAMAGTQAMTLRNKHSISEKEVLEEMSLNLSASEELSEAFPEDAIVSVWDKDSDEELSINIASRLNQLFSFYLKGNKLLTKEKKLLQLLILSSGVPIDKKFISFILETEPVFPNLRVYHLIEETEDCFRIHYLASMSLNELLFKPEEKDSFYRELLRRWLLVYRHLEWQTYRFLFLRIIRELGLLGDRDLTPEEWIFRFIVSEIHPENLNNSICFADSIDKPCLIAMIQDEDSIFFVSYTAFRYEDPDNMAPVSYFTRNDIYSVLFRISTDKLPADETYLLWKYWFIDEDELENLVLPKAPEGIHNCSIISSIFQTIQIQVLVMRDNYDFYNRSLWDEKVKEAVLLENGKVTSLFKIKTQDEYLKEIEEDDSDMWFMFQKIDKTSLIEKPISEKENINSFDDFPIRFMTPEEEELLLAKESEWREKEWKEKKFIDGQIEGFSAYLADEKIIKLMLPENTLSIPEYAFSTTQPTIGSPFDFAHSLQFEWPFNGTLIIPDGIKEIGNSAFYAQKGITGLKLPPSVEIIGSNAFAFTGLKGTIVLPPSLKKIEIDCFYYVESMDTLIIENPDLIINIDPRDLDPDWMKLYPIWRPELVVKTHYNSNTWNRLCELGFMPEPLPYE